MPLFGKKKSDTADFDANTPEMHAKFEQIQADLERLMASPADLATELMPAFGPDGLKRGDKPRGKGHLMQWLMDQHELSLKQLRKYAGKPSRQQAMYVMRLDKRLDAPILEAAQLLQHAELIYESQHTEVAAYWSATRLGLATLASGKDAVRQRIKDRTGQ
jgi:hypothetical protein